MFQIEQPRFEDGSLNCLAANNTYPLRPIIVRHSLIKLMV